MLSEVALKYDLNKFLNRNNINTHPNNSRQRSCQVHSSNGGTKFEVHGCPSGLQACLKALTHFKLKPPDWPFQSGSCRQRGAELRVPDTLREWPGPGVNLRS